MIKILALFTFACVMFLSPWQSSEAQKVDQPLAKQISVNGTTIRYWEQGKGVPQLITIPAAMHRAPWQNTTAFNEALLAFLARN